MHTYAILSLTQMQPSLAHIGNMVLDAWEARSEVSYVREMQNDVSIAQKLQRYVKTACCNEST